MATQDISTTAELKRLSKSWDGQKVGLVTGCFDVLHLGHVSLLNFAKSKVDILLVGIESDRSVKINKGRNRPIFDQTTRATVIGHLQPVDYVFIVDHGTAFGSSAIDDFFISLSQDLRVTHLITNEMADRFHLEKMSRAKLLGIKMILQQEGKFSSSTEIIEKIGL